VCERSQDHGRKIEKGGEAKTTCGSFKTPHERRWKESQKKAKKGKGRLRHQHQTCQPNLQLHGKIPTSKQGGRELLDARYQENCPEGKGWKGVLPKQNPQKSTGRGGSGSDPGNARARRNYVRERTVLDDCLGRCQKTESERKGIKEKRG